MTRAVPYAAAGFGLALTLAVAVRLALAQDAADPASAAAKTQAPARLAPKPGAPPSSAPQRQGPAADSAASATPLSEREVELVALEKLSGNHVTLKARPGQTVSWRDLTIAIRACEARPPWEPPEAGAFLQIDEKLRNGAVERRFSGWTFAVARSINGFESPNYAVWLKSCAMSFPDKGPETVLAAGAEPRRPASAARAAEAPPPALAEDGAADDAPVEDAPPVESPPQ